jgi:hypothetical protein
MQAHPLGIDVPADHLADPADVDLQLAQDLIELVLRLVGERIRDGQERGHRLGHAETLTADVYSAGESEEIVGKTLKDRRDDVNLNPADTSYGAQNLEPSLRRR